MANEKPERKSQRSDKYQHIFAECQVSYEILSSFTTEDSISAALSANFAYSEDILDLQDQLTQAYWRLINTLLTPKQLVVIKLLASGETQHSAAKLLGRNQSSTAKVLHGNTQYNTNGGKPYRSGGVIKKLSKAAKEDKEIQDIIKQILELQQNTW